VNELYNIGYILRVLRYETTGNKQKLKRKTVQHIFIATTRVYFTQCALLFVRHTVQTGVEVSSARRDFSAVMSWRYIHLGGNGVRTSNRRRCSPRGHLRLHMSMKSTTSRAGPFSQEWTARNGTVCAITVKKRHLCAPGCLAETCALADSSGCSPTADTN